jgi:D-alanyl-D-alanine carboxypeptidase/D-alanyl-D-alanine-endopeptidase (penicillin-binding protein 4)
LLNREAPTKDTRWVNHVLTGPPGSGDQVVVYSEPGGRTITLRGSVPLGEKRFTVNGAIPDPPARARELLQARLEASGVKFLGRDLPLRSEGLIFAHRASPPLPEIIDHLHKVSDNLEAQCLFLAIGQEKEWKPAEVVRRHWEGRGVTFTGLRMIDGSGLARANMIRPLDLARVNHLARRGPHGERFKQSLSSYLDGKVRSKLGAMSGVKTEVGFLTLDDGREWTFALMANGLDLTVDFWPLREKLLREVASMPTRR